MIRLDPFCFCTNAVPSGDLYHALDMAEALGFSHVELSAIDGINEQLHADQYSAAYVAEVRAALEQRHLTCYAVSGHCDMTDPTAFQRLLNKIRIAGELGAAILNTRCGPKARYAVFRENVREAAALTASYGMMLHLESYGDIVGPASECGSVFRNLQLENVRYTYDAGNTFRFAKGEISIPADLRHAAVRPSYLHLKDSSIRDGWIYNEPIGAGVLEIPEILSILEQSCTVLPCGLEVPLNFRVSCKDLSFDYRSPKDSEVLSAIRQSIAYLQTLAEVTLSYGR